MANTHKIGDTRSEIDYRLQVLW